METFLPKIVKEFAQKIKERSHYLSKHFVAFIHSLSFFSDVHINEKKNCDSDSIKELLSLSCSKNSPKINFCYR
jgi:hypothetical protein